MRSSLALRISLLGGGIWLYWSLSGSCLDALTFTGLVAKKLKHQEWKIQRFQAAPANTNRDAHLCLLDKIESSLPSSPTDESVFENPGVGNLMIFSDHFEKISEGINTVFSKTEYSQGRHMWHVKKLAGFGVRHRLGICLGNMSWDTNPAHVAADSSCWFYEDGSGSLNQRVASQKVSRSSSQVPIAMYDEEELAIILDSDHGKLYYFWPTGEEAVIGGLPANSMFRLFISVEGKGDSWQVREQQMPQENTEQQMPNKKVYADDTWIMRLYRKLPGF
mmetsp:Transcript_59418/g.105685  ORF Transcript_59418/g.105685 Transcript_59418/m.105685 type:complete len:277 (-) Transcript_59418:348-1178(-)